MFTYTSDKIAQANHKNHIGLKASIDSVQYNDASTTAIFHDFIRHNSRGWMLPKSSKFGLFLAFQQGNFQARCFEAASRVIEGYDGGQWKISADGIYCIESKKTDTFVVSCQNYRSAVCNPLETGLIITLMALDHLMHHSNEVFSRAMCFYHEFLIALIKEQFNVENPLIDPDKVFHLLE